jgi:hypothetical protein
VTWKLSGGEHLAGPAGRRDLAAECEARLRTEFFLNESKSVLWTHAVQLDQPDLPEGWYEEESMLGDFLRNLRELAALDPAAVDLVQHVPEQHRIPALAELSRWSEEEHRTLLFESALTGAQLLGAGERDP